MRINAEILKNIYEDFSLQKAIITPIILSLVFYLSYLSKGALGVFIWSLMVIYFVGFIWGAKEITSSIFDEVRGKTWNFIKISQVSPKSLTLGKLIGSGLFSWYIVAISTVALIVSYFCLSKAQLHQYHILSNNFGLSLALLLLSIILLHSIALNYGLLLIKTKLKEKGGTFLIILLAIIFARFIHSVFSIKLTHIDFYNMEVNFLQFVTLSLGIFLLFSLAFNYNLIRQELSMATSSLAWLGFNLFLIFYSYGFFYHQDKVIAWFLIISQYPLLLYLNLIYENTSLIEYKRIWFLTTKFKFWELFNKIPRFVYTYIILTVLCLYYISIFQDAKMQGFSFNNYSNEIRLELPKDLQITTLIVASLLFVLRDIILIQYCKLNSRIKRPILFASIILTMLYFIVPAILSLLHLSTALFLPINNFSIVSGILQTGIVGALIVNMFFTKSLLTKQQYF